MNMIIFFKAFFYLNFSLSLSVTSRLLNTHDIPILLVELVQNPPWTKQKKGKMMNTLYSCLTDCIYIIIYTSNL